MKSIPFLEEQVEIYKKYVSAAEDTRNEFQRSLDKAQYEYESHKIKLHGLETILKMVREDFKQYGWNPAG